MKGMIGVRQSGEQVALYVPSRLRRISWTAVGAGIGIALLIQFMFTIHGHLYQFLMGVGAGMGTDGPHPYRDAHNRRSQSYPGVLLAESRSHGTLIGSSVASRVAETSYRHQGVLHGLLTWGGIMLLTLCLPTTIASSLMGGTFGVQIATAPTAHIVSQASLGAITTPFVGILVSALGGALGTPRHL